MPHLSVCNMGILHSGKLPEKPSVKKEVCNVGSLGEVRGSFGKEVREEHSFIAGMLV